MSEGYPVRVIESYYKDYQYDHLRDNGFVPIAGKTFDSYIPCGQEPTDGQIVLRDCPERPLPQELKDGIMMITDTWSVIAIGPGMEGKV